MQRFAAALAFIATAFLTTFAYAGPPKGRSIVVFVEGPGAEHIAARIEAHVAPTDNVVEPTKFAAGINTHLPPESRIAQYRAAAVRAHVDLAIVVQIHKGKRKMAVHVTVVDPVVENPLVDRDIPLAPSATASDQANATWEAVHVAVEYAPPKEEAASPAPPEKPSAPAPSATTDSTTEPSASPEPASDHGVTESSSPESRARSTRASTPLITQVGAGGGSRHFSYNQRYTSSLRPYNLPAAPYFLAGIEAYPLSSMGNPFLRGLGVTASASTATALSSQDSSGTRVGTAWQSYDVGVRERYSVTRAVLVGVGVGYGAIRYKFSEDTPTGSGPAQLPTVGYSLLRVGADARWTLSAFALFGGGGAMDILSTGAIGQMFPHEQVGGIEAHGGVAYSVTRHVELSLSADYQRFFYAFRPNPGDPDVAGGALDEFSSITAGAAFVL